MCMQPLAKSFLIYYVWCVSSFFPQPPYLRVELCALKQFEARRGAKTKRTLEVFVTIVILPITFTE